MVFIDLEKAFGKVHMEVSWRCLESRDILVSYIRETKDIDDGAKTQVGTMGGDSEHFRSRLDYTRD